MTTDGDRGILAFVAAHRVVLATHVQALLRVSEPDAHHRLAALTDAGLISHHHIFHAQPGHYQITRSGLRSIGSGLPSPRYETLHTYRHDIGVAWLWLAATGGTFGSVERVLSEREMRSHDTARTAAQQARERSEPIPPPDDDGEPAFGVRTNSTGPREPNPPHYPDLMLITKLGRLAIELELYPTGQRRLELILAAYGADPTITALYLVDDRDIGRTIQATAARLELSAHTHVQLVQLDRTTPTEAAQ